MRAKRARELRRAAFAHTFHMTDGRGQVLLLARQLYRRLKRAWTRRNAT